MMNSDRWAREDEEALWRIVDSALEKSQVANIDILDFAPELKMKGNKNFSFWVPPGPSSHRPQMDLRNLNMLYDKIIIPLYPMPDKSAFESVYGISVDDLATCIMSNPERYKLVLGANPAEYNQKFYKEIFNTCKDIPPPAIYARIRMFLLFTRLRIIADREGIKTDNENWTNRVYEKHPEFTLDYCRTQTKQMFELDHGKSLQELSQIYQQVSDFVLDDVAEASRCLRIFGYDPLPSIGLKLANALKDPSIGSSVIKSYARYLIEPFDSCLGGFTNYDLDDVWTMSFLRVLPLEHQDLSIVKESLYQSPASRKLLLQKVETRINVFCQGRIDQQSLEATLKISEKYPELHHHMCDYRRKIAQGDLASASEVPDHINEILTEQYSKELEDWNRKTRFAKFIKESLAWGASLVVIPPLFLADVSIEWKIMLIVAIERFKRSLYRKIGLVSPEGIVEKLWKVDKWPIEQRGVPYILWKTGQSVESEGWSTERSR